MKNNLLADILKKTDSSVSSAKSLEDRGLIKIIEKEIERNYSEEYKENHETFELTKNQKSIVEKISENFKPYKFADLFVAWCYRKRKNSGLY